MIGARRGARGRMDAIMRQLDSAPTTLAGRSGVACREAGQALALARCAAWRGFSPQLPNVEQVCAVLQRTARQGPAGRAAIETLDVLLRCLPRRSCVDLPVLRVTNQHLAARLGCCVRQVQRQLARLHRLGIIAIDWGRANSRLCFDRHDDDQGSHSEKRLVGIDLRPAIVFAHEQLELEQALEAARRAYSGTRDAATGAIWQAKLAVLHDRSGVPSHPAGHEECLDRLRANLRRLDRRAHATKATAADIQACTRQLGEIEREASEIRAVIHKAVDDPEDKAVNRSSNLDQPASQKTDSNCVESVVPTNQGDGQTGAAGKEDVAGAEAQGVNALIYRQWLAVHEERVAPSSGEVLELELHSRQLARQLGVARRVVNIAIERHGPMPVIGAILHVAALPASARIRSPGGLLASLLRREPGQLTPDRLTRGAPPAEALSESEAAAIARRCAPNHQPYWVCTRWRATQQRRGVPIRDPRRCLEGFARTLERTQGRHAG